MATLTPTRHERTTQLLNKVPEITVYFWLIKIMGTTVGETGADFLNENLGLGLHTTALLPVAALAIALTVQFSLRRYVPVAYWLVVVLVSVVGTLLSDELVDGYGVALTTTTTVFAVLLAVTFAVWYARERTLSIHAVTTRPREAFYWLAVLLTFALGTSAGDLVAEHFDLGYWTSAALFGLAIAVVAALRFGAGANATACFWVAYILTRPLGASVGDGLSQPENGGLGLGTTTTSLLFLAAIVVLVAYLSRTGVDRTEHRPVAA